MLGGKLFAEFDVAAAAPAPMVGEVSPIPGCDWLAFIEIPRPTFDVYPLATQIAEKLHALTLLPRPTPNTRDKDLPDLAILARLSDRRRSARARIWEAPTMTGHRLTTHTIADEAALRAVIGEATEIVCSKVASRLNALTRPFIERSPFLCLATSDPTGACDVSPRGDPRGFVRILDDETLLIPERPGNRIADSLRNILANPHVGLLFVIPGVTDTFRVNGRATLTTDAALLEPCVVEGEVPKLGIVVDILEAYTQCSKAFLRSHLWDPSTFIDRAELPTNGEIMAVLKGEGFDGKKYDEERAERYARREGFY